MIVSEMILVKPKEYLGVRRKKNLFKIDSSQTEKHRIVISGSNNKEKTMRIVKTVLVKWIQIAL